MKNRKFLLQDKIKVYFIRFLNTQQELNKNDQIALFSKIIILGHWLDIQQNKLFSYGYKTIIK